jgi:peptide/nickel transport system substrate-binding protein
MSLIFLSGDIVSMAHLMRWRVVLATMLLAVTMPSAAATDDRLRIGIKGDIASLDPHVLNETLTLGVLSNVMEGLVRHDADLKLRPGLATRWETLSPLHWRFHLRKGVQFHDGTPFTASDVLFMFERARKPRSQMRSRIPDGARIIAVDAHTVDVHLEKPNPILPANWESLLIMSRPWAERHGLADPGAVPQSAPDPPANGTGPYQVISHRAGQVTRFERHAMWWGAARGLARRVDLFTLTNAQTRTAALLSGQVDLIVPAPVQDLARISATDRFKTVTGAELRTIFLNMDQMREELAGAPAGTANPFMDRRVRQAVYHAIDIDMIRRKVMLGLSAPATSLVSPLLLPGIGDIERARHDPQRARQLLRDAGYENGFDVDMDCPNNRYVNDEQICLAIVQMLARIDIRVHLNAQPKALFFKKVLSGGGYDSALNLLGWTPATLDAWNVLDNVARCRDDKGNGARFNLGGYCNGEVERLTALALGDGDPARRSAMMVQAFRLIHEDAGFIPLHQQTLAWAMSDHLDATVRADNQIKFDALRLRPAARQSANAPPGRGTGDALRIR